MPAPDDNHDLTIGRADIEINFIGIYGLPTDCDLPILSSQNHQFTAVHLNGDGLSIPHIHVSGLKINVL